MTKKPKRYLIAAVFVLAAVLRLTLIFSYGDFLNGDEAVVGLMAKHIGEGTNFPVFYYGQPYMGSMEAMLAALLFALGGISTLTLRLSPFLFSMAFLVVIYLSARRFQIPGFAGLVLLLAAFPPVFFTQWGITPRGGFIEVLFWGQLSLLFFSFILKRPASVGYYLGAGLALGLGFWTNPLIIPYLLTVGVGIIIIVAQQVKKRALLISVAAAAFMVGAAPLIIYNLIHPAATLAFLVKSFFKINRDTLESQGWGESLKLVIAKNLWLNPAGSIRGLGYVFQVGSNGPLNIFNQTLIAGFGLLFLLLGFFRRLKPGQWLILSYCVLMVLTLWLGASGKFIPRYFLPLYSVYPIALSLVLLILKKRNQHLFVALLAVIIILNIAGNIEALIHPPKNEQSEFIGILDSLGIDRGYAPYELSYSLTFQSSERIILSPSIPRYSQTADRYPLYTHKVDQAEKRIYILPADSRENIIFRLHLEQTSSGYDHTIINGYSLYYNLEQQLDSLDLRRLFADIL